MSFQHITVDHLDLEGGKEKTAVITLNRPDRGNALTKDAKKEIVQAIRQGNRDAHTRSFILAAQGKIFCSGQDLNERDLQNQADLGQTLVTEWIPLIREIRHSPRPIIAAVGGTCAGAGLSLALSCDLLVARPGAKFISGFSKLGLAPDAGSNFTLVQGPGLPANLGLFPFEHSPDLRGSPSGGTRERCPRRCFRGGEGCCTQGECPGPHFGSDDQEKCQGGPPGNVWRVPRAGGGHSAFSGEVSPLPGGTGRFF